MAAFIAARSVTGREFRSSAASGRRTTFAMDLQRMSYHYDSKFDMAERAWLQWEDGKMPSQEGWNPASQMIVACRGYVSLQGRGWQRDLGCWAARTRGGA